MEIHDLVLSKLAAGRRRDVDYARQARADGLLDLDTLRARVPGSPVNAPHRARILALVEGLANVPLNN